MTEKHYSLPDKCFPSESADSYAVLASQYQEPHHTRYPPIKKGARLNVHPFSNPQAPLTSAAYTCLQRCRVTLANHFDGFQRLG